MFTADQYRTKAIEYSNLLKIANGQNEEREFRKLERSFAELADNAEWIANNQGNSCWRPSKQLRRSSQMQRRRGLRSDKAKARANLSCPCTFARQSLAPLVGRADRDEQRDPIWVSSKLIQTLHELSTY